MPPLRAEESTVSLPPRERRLAKRRARAMKLGLPPSTMERSAVKAARRRQANQPTPTLASTRARRSGELAFFNKADGFHIKRVVRRAMPHSPVPRVPYLPGQEDIPHSDTESDIGDTTSLKEVLPSLDGAIVEPEELGTEPDELDYDAEGEDDDVTMDDEPLRPSKAPEHMRVDSPAGVGLDGSLESNNLQQWATMQPAYQSMDLIGDTSPEELQVLFGGLDNFPRYAHLPSADNGFSDNGVPSTNSFPSNNTFHFDNMSVGYGLQAGLADSSADKNSAADTWPSATTSRSNHSAYHLFGSCSPQLSAPSYSAPADHDARGSGAAFAMHKLHSVVNDLQTLHPSPQHSHSTSLRHRSVDHTLRSFPSSPSPRNPTATALNGLQGPTALDHAMNSASIRHRPNCNTLGLTLNRMGTPLPVTSQLGQVHAHGSAHLDGIPLSQAGLRPQAPTPARPQSVADTQRSATPNTWGSRAGTPATLLDHVQSPTPSSSRISTRDLVSLARAHSRPPGTQLPIPPASPARNIIDSPLRHSRHSLLSTPLHHSISPPNFVPSPIINPNHIQPDTQAEWGEQPLADSDHEASRPSTPVSIEDTDIDLERFPPVIPPSPRPGHFPNIQLLRPQLVTNNVPRIPTQLDLRSKARSYYKLSRRGRRVRRVAPDAPPLRTGMRAATMNANQKVMMHLMEHHVLWDMIITHPWPEDRDRLLQDAQDYAKDISGISGSGVATEDFLDTVFNKLPSLRSNPLAKIEFMMEKEFAVTSADKSTVLKLMSNDLFLYPNSNREASQYFCVGALGCTLEVILFKSSKNIGLAFMENLCQPDNVVKCAHWHRKRRDLTADEGVPPAAIALAATMMYWALEKMYLGVSGLHFNEQHYLAVWERYFRAVIALPHLGRLRKELLDRLKEYYICQWPAPERDDDDTSPPAW